MEDPKVFISYSWSDQSHQELVKHWADRLVADGVDVILDIYDLKEGDDKYAFMESMVTDPEVTHVLVICDKVYADKANARKAGVGTESQIISGEVYQRVKQSKFIPIVCEFSEGEPILPAFMQSRMWINFSSSEAENENWEQLIRLLYGKPQYVKPKKGKAPTFITSNTPIPTSEAFAKFNSLKQAVLQDKKGLNHYRRDFIESCIAYADDLRVRERPDVESIGEKVLEDCNKLKAVRNHLCDWVLLESEITDESAFSESLIEVLEKLRELKSRPPEINSWNDSWFEAHSVFVYETFLYIVAALLKSGAYGVLNDIYTSHYLLPSSDQYGNKKFEKFDCFYGYSETLQSVLAPPNQKLYSPAAELIKKQADREDIPFSDIRQADLLTLLMSFITPGTRWYPATLHYSSYGSDYPFFIRAAQHKNFLKLAKITGIESVEVLRSKINEGKIRVCVSSWHNFLYESDFGSSMNIEELDSLR
ncbi:TIR domain-containing protein [Shewanella sp. SR43-4]|uniref:toll/interleukin-1 receptor domain-containing protein n=1 Tax=Shewanella sp. SR43-4 TaxID=2760942 RepID=UPI0015F89ABC|nr:toll/interleukin-1 receptor domain-containing protein [Shewanella sp. SR43-4]MBB1319370.1 TIR domain-containing protein [Shewanella sp. SR43-4]|tara:strand:+ start:1027 stop:2460 length:1434 start_codon:yes stop_codon:yes gene_type:complete